MDFLTERKIEASGWVIKARWFYMIGILIIGFLTKTLSESNLSFSYVEMVSIVIIFSGVNIFFILLLKKIKKELELTGKVNTFWLGFLNKTQIVVELITFTFVMHKAGGVESISSVFFFLPIVSSALICEAYASIVVAIIAGLLINALVLGEYVGFIPHIDRYMEPTLDYTSLSVGLTKTITTAVFYVVIGIFSTFSSRLILKREALLRAQKEELDKEGVVRINQLEQIEKTTKLLVSRDRELSKMNKELDKKIRELEYSKTSLTQALDDLNKNKKIIEEEKNKTASIIANFSDPILVLNKENRLSLFNEPAKKILGLTDADLNKEISNKDEFSLDNFREVIRKRFDFKKLRKPEREEIDLLEELNLTATQEEDEKTFKVITVKITDSKKEYRGTMKMFYDVTREKNIDKMKSDFISIAAHQLRTPLSAIKWSAGMLLKGDIGEITPEQANLLQKSYDSNERMINLVNDLLNVSRIEEGRFGYHFENIELSEIVKIILETARPMTEKSGIEIVVDEKIAKLKICADKEKLLLALQNLVDNAVKYTPNGGKVEIKVKDQKEDFLILSIKDNGVGIPKKDLPKLFSKFFRASNVILMQTDGTGLGLFIVRSIIEKHGGKIEAQSEENKGTEFILTLPTICKKESD